MSLPETRGRVHAIAAAWPVLRALLVTIGLGVWALSALPERPYSEERFARATHRRLVYTIEDALFTLGIDVSEEQIKHALIVVTEPLVHARNVLVAPFVPALDFAGMGQRWGLFLQSGRTAFRIQVEGRLPSGDWRVLYRPHGEDPLGLASTLAFRRMRGIYNPGSKGLPRPQFEGFVSWLSDKIFAEHPEYQEVRVVMERVRLASRDEPNRILDIAHESSRLRPGAS